MIKAFNIPIITAIPIDTLNKIVVLPFPIIHYMINNYNKSSNNPMINVIENGN
jgi:hypothetical protein